MVSFVQQLTHTRTITWEDPAPGFARAAEMSGLEYLQAMIAGELPPPPMAATLGMELVEVGDGRALFAAEPADYHYNPIGVVHGGLAATLLDSATGCAVQTTVARGVAYTTLELKTNFVRAITRDTGRVLCEAEVVHRGGTIATAEGRLRAESTGKLLAHGTSTCLIIAANGGRPSGNGNGNGSPA
jgi:uncharacterized protein (TIGR00369 family)